VVEPLGTGTEGAEPTLVMIAGPEIGRHIAIDQSSMSVGRGSECEMAVQMPGVSRRHCEFLSKDAGVFVRDLGSTNGTFVNEQRLPDRESVPIRPGDLIQAGGVAFKLVNGGDLEREYHEAVHAMMFLDVPTGARNRRYLMDLLAREIPRCQRHHRPLSILMLDVDNFKTINDAAGHLVGDEVLRELVARMQKATRSENAITRFGGDEFVVVMPETRVGGAHAYAERVRLAIADREFEAEGQPLRVTVSIGVAECGPEHTTPEHLLDAADRKLYASKRSGRNRIS
jgi:diguanylate cyclase (GGDEF)-like protein